MKEFKPTRRSFLKTTAGGIWGTTLGPSLKAEQTPAAFQNLPKVEFQAIDRLPEKITRTWIGPAFWANRLQDWRLNEGRIECLTGNAGDEIRTVAVLTREIVKGQRSAHFSVRSGSLEGAGQNGFRGFLIGAGSGRLDYRAAALVQKASGVGGGLICAFESDGRARFREHTDEENFLAFAELAADESSPSGVAPAKGNQEVLTRLDITPQEEGKFELKFSVWDSQGNRFVAGAIRRNVPESEILGGIALVSSPYPRKNGARFWFSDLKTGGDKIRVWPARALGPLIGTLYSLNGKVMKMSAQFMPIGNTEPQYVKLQYRTAGMPYQDGPTVKLAPGYTALFRIDDWDSSQDFEYRLAYPADSRTPQYYPGLIRKDPANRDRFTIGLFSCMIATARSLEGGGPKPQLPEAEVLGRYSSKNIYFPHAQLVKNANSHRPDLLVFAGDQLYEGNPTRRDNSQSPTLDYLYKWYLWVWSFRDVTRTTPAILLVDDHDVYHGNVWGNGGRAAPEGDQNRGGYRCSADFVNLVQRTQCSHNPDPFDPTPIDRGISVYYGSFRFGGASFAILEDRKFKTAPLQGADLDVHEAELLGERQEKFLEAWAQEPAEVKICLTQTVFACVQTSPSGRPLLDFDSNGYPKLARDRALRLLTEARALVLAGDQHLATLVRHGLDSCTDAVIQFTGPATGTSWQRWFEPAKPLPHAGSTLHTGDFTDAFGNEMRVLAVANPKITFGHYRAYNKGRGQGQGDRRLKSEGYGVIRVDRKAKEFVIECWPWDVDPGASSAGQFAGWPYRLPFSELVL